MNDYIFVQAKIINEGLAIIYDNKEYLIKYPKAVWKKVPDKLKGVLRDNLAYATTIHLPMVVPNVKGIHFETNRPLLEPYFFQNFIMDIPSCTIIDGLNTEEMTRKFLLLENTYASDDILRSGSGSPAHHSSQAFIGLSFGKDSLLTFALANELGLDPEIVYIVEESLKNEYKHKIALAEKFKKEFHKELYVIHHETGKLRDYDYLQLPKSEFGWGLQNTEYVLEILPFTFAFDGKYIFFGNEQSTKESYFDITNSWRIFPCYDQTHVWSKHLDQITQMLTNGVVRTGSLIEPLMDIMVQRILIRRYPEIAKYQMSCFAETDAGKDYHWCHECFVCGKMYLLAIASGMDPKKIGFRKNMLEVENKNLFTLFGGKTAFTYAYTGKGRDEQLFAFYLAAKKRVAGGLIEEFRKSPLFQEAKEREEELAKTFFTIYDSISVPRELKEKVYSIYKEEFNSVEI